MVRTFIRVVLATGAIFIISNAPSALACPVLLKASPRVGASVTGPVNEVTLHFSGTIDPAQSDLKVFDAQGHTVSAGKPFGLGNPVETIGVKIRAVAPGAYKVKWHVHCDCEEGKGSVFPGDYSFILR